MWWLFVYNYLPTVTVNSSAKCSTRDQAKWHHHEDCVRIKKHNIYILVLTNGGWILTVKRHFNEHIQLPNIFCLKKILLLTFNVDLPRWIVVIGNTSTLSRTHCPLEQHRPIFLLSCLHLNLKIRFSQLSKKHSDSDPLSTWTCTCPSLTSTISFCVSRQVLHVLRLTLLNVLTSSQPDYVDLCLVYM